MDRQSCALLRLLEPWNKSLQNPSISRINLFIRDNLIPTFCFYWNPCTNLFVKFDSYRKNFFLFWIKKRNQRRRRRRKKVVPRYDHANLPCWSLRNLRIIHIEIREEIFPVFFSLWWKHRTTQQFVDRLQTPWFGIVDKNLESFLRHSFTLFRTLWGRPHEHLIIRNNYTARVENVGARGEGESRGLRSGRLQLRQSWLQLQGNAVWRAHKCGCSHKRGKTGLKKESHSVGA